MSESTALAASQWIYQGLWAALVRFFKVPDQPPTLPTCGGIPARSFRPAEGFLKALKFQFWLVLLVLDLLIVFVWIIITSVSFIAGAILFLPMVALVVVPDLVAYVAIHLRYDTTWYVLTDRSLRIRRGVWHISEVTITFENIQSVTVNQGPLQRYFNIANVQIETAGGGGGGAGGPATASSHTGVIEGVDDAQSIRDLIMDKVRASKSAGLGDDRDQDPSSGQTTWKPTHLDVLRETRDICLCLTR